METEIMNVLAILFEQVSKDGLLMLGEPVKMTIEQCVELAKSINTDLTHPYLVSCIPMWEEVIVQ
jgi:hypothetical protein